MRELNQNELQAISGAGFTESVKNGCSYTWDVTCSTIANTAYYSKNIIVMVAGFGVGGSLAATFVREGFKACAPGLGDSIAARTLYVVGGIIGAKLSLDYVA